MHHSNAENPTERPHVGHHLLATIYRRLSIDDQAVLVDFSGRQVRLPSEGTGRFDGELCGQALLNMPVGIRIKLPFTPAGIALAGERMARTRAINLAGIADAPSA